jgi:lipid II:glycine glycyltransferase (peptidoglycan interpeptide bridge formation enzyme)
VSSYEKQSIFLPVPPTLLSSEADRTLYADWVRRHPSGSLWQSLEWAGYQETLGRKVRIYSEKEGDRFLTSALVLEDSTSLGLTTWEIARGPLLAPFLGESDKAQALARLVGLIEENARKEGVLSLSFAPPSATPPPSGFRPSGRLVYPEATRVLDLTASEEALLSQMKQKGRYNIGVAEKKGVTVQKSIDIEAFTALSAETKRRDRFLGPKIAQYSAFLTGLPGSFLLLTHSPTSKKPIAGLLGVVWGQTGIYYYGASGNTERDLMAPYLLQWEAMKLCKAEGCTRYDLFGIAPEDATNHPWEGVSRFKAQFGGVVETYPAEQRKILRPFAHGLLSLKRRIF